MASAVPLKSQLNNNSWNNHWGKTSDVAAYDASATHVKTLNHFWKNRFSAISLERNKLLDIASGGGALLETLVRQDCILPEKLSEFYSADLSYSALRSVKSKYPLSKVLQTNCAQLPFKNESFNFIISQFGIEYCGLSAFKECSRVLRKDGRFIAICHYQDGAIQAECERNLKVLYALSDIDFFAHARRAFNAKDDKMSGDFSIKIDATFRNALYDVSDLVTRQPYAAGGQLLRLFNDTRYMYENLTRFDTSAVLHWLTKMEEELTNYQERMILMLQSSLNNLSLNKAVEAFTANGVRNVKIDVLSANRNFKPFAWAIEVF
ncbi:class I SAM-dependent methyltransferase [Paraglaciecola sp. T6c]|uniref:class I SAM-dependent methyltransferase n=1 Tax=Pseudoalteromonas atlantica (strain T6c / ATCC BAA-1087) TaxID=3042615 RepID=UPI0005A00932|nr:class I SAM-dependent methyltransferase [Paraglaciecola sp. T6c]